MRLFDTVGFIITIGIVYKSALPDLKSGSFIVGFSIRQHYFFKTSILLPDGRNVSGL
jgi:hypothetical protein